MIKLVSMVPGITEQLEVLTDGLPDLLIALGVFLQVVIDGLARRL